MTFSAAPRGSDMPKLTQRFIDSIQATEVRQTFWDDTLRGFGVRVSPPSQANPRGNRSYVVKHRIRLPV